MRNIPYSVNIQLISATEQIHTTRYMLSFVWYDQQLVSVFSNIAFEMSFQLSYILNKSKLQDAILW